MSATRWGGSESRRARAQCKPLVLSGTAICPRCGHPVIHDPRRKAGGWHPDHYPVRREDGGKRVVPAHDHCNTSDGGKRGAAITNARRRARRGFIDKRRNIRGV